MPLKNDIVTLEITALTCEGSGVGRLPDGMVVFVPDTAPGDVIDCRIVKVTKHYCYGMIDRLGKPSPKRCGDNCPVGRKCGGCCFRHIDYAHEAAEKQGFVRDAFERIGGLSPEFLPMIAADSPDRYRNKAQFPVSADESGRLFAGFFAKRSHRAIQSADCLLLPEEFIKMRDSIIDFCNDTGVTAYDERTGEGLLRHIFLRRGVHSGEIMAALVVTSDECTELFKRLGKRLAAEFSALRSFLLNVNPDRTNVILGGKTVTLFGREHIFDTMCGKTVSVSLHSFYQINTVQAERVYRQAAEFAGLTGGETLLDLYCGAGTIGLSMADSVKNLIGVEVIPQAIENAKANAAANGITNAEFICGDAGKAARVLFERGERPDVIIADPARKGCTRDTLEYMAKMDPARIVMISCNPATAARDCAILGELGYKTEKCRAADFFPRTNHVECVVMMTKNTI
jgi:23S rRNA (uracil1939-C5)-methyltransferase